MIPRATLRFPSTCSFSEHDSPIGYKSFRKLSQARPNPSMAEMSRSSKPDQVTLSLALSPGSTPRQARPEERGIRLIQLLLTCAKHASSGNLHRADECLQQISLLASVSGDSMQRLSAWFASALAVRLVKRWPGLHKALNRSQLPKRDVLGQAQPIIGRALPYPGFLYGFVSRTLVKVMMREQAIHLVDLCSGDANLWIPLIQSFSCLQDGPPHLKITCMNANKAVLENLGPRLVKEAETLNINFQFSALNVGLRELTLDKLKVKSGEALAFISILNLHTLLAEDDGVDAHFSHNKTNGIKDSKQMSRFLSTIRTFSPKLFLLVEKEADHNLNNLVDRFVEGLHYYSAVFDSVNATFTASTSSGERLVLEEMYGKEIENIVACEGVEREERHERYGRWMVRFGQAGFKPARTWHGSMEDAKQMMEACGGNGYKIVNERASLMICWHARPLYAVSAWTC